MTWIEVVSRLLIIFIAFPLHEFGHAWMAHAFGDDTAKDQGRLTLNPLKHIDPLGAIALLGFGFGWAKAVPVNQAKLREKGRLAPIATAAAGAMINFFLMALLFIILRVVLNSTITLPIYLLEVMVQFMLINVVLIVFNLLPIPPLDGFLILRNLLPPSAERFMAILNQYGILILVVLFYIFPRIGFDPFGNLLSYSIEFVWNLLLA